MYDLSLFPDAPVDALSLVSANIVVLQVAQERNINCLDL